MPVRLANHPRVVVIGTSGSGKTTFARALATALGVPHIELDALHWGPNWTVRADFEERVAVATSAAAWVVDGNYGAVRSLTWSRATAVVWLNYDFCVVFARAVKRTFRRIATRELVHGNRETLSLLFSSDGIPRWVIASHQRLRDEHTHLFTLPEHHHLELFEMRTPGEAARLLSQLQNVR